MASRKAYTSEGQLCTSGHHEFIGNLSLSKSASAQRARKKLAIALAEQISPYHEKLKSSLDIEIDKIV